MMNHAKTSGLKVSGLAVCGLLSLLGAGCDVFMQKPLCPELSNCGGPVPIGTWVLDPHHPSCSEDLYVAPTDPRLPGGTLPAARTPLIEPALYDWCDQLLLQAFNEKTGTLVLAANFYTPDIQIGAGTVTFKTDGTYSAGLTRTGSFTLAFPALCVREFGATDNNPAFDYNANMTSGPPVNICKQIELPLGQMGMGPGSFRNTSCSPDGAGGCDCTFDATETGGGAGTYLTQATDPVLDSNIILALPGKDFPQNISYCNTGNELQLTGANGEYLFGTLGLRTLDLVLQP
jgi:hypothetical protein